MTPPASESRSPWALWTTLGFAAAMAVVAGLQRYFPHPWNLTLIGALALWGGARLSPWLGAALPLGVWAITDLLEWQLNGYFPFNPFVAAGFLGYAVLGLTLRKTSSPARLFGTCLLGSAQFFLLTNFSAWAHMSVDPGQMPEGKAFVVVREGQFEVPAYARNAAGLAACYVNAIPFSNPEARPMGYLGNLVAGDLLGTLCFFGLHTALLAVVAGRRDPLPARTRP